MRIAVLAAATLPFHSQFCTTSRASKAMKTPMMTIANSRASLRESCQGFGDGLGM